MTIDEKKAKARQQEHMQIDETTEVPMEWLMLSDDEARDLQALKHQLEGDRSEEKINV